MSDRRRGATTELKGLLFSVRRRAGFVLASVGIAATAASLWMTVPLTRHLEQSTIGSSAGNHLEIAVNLVWCGRYPYLTSIVLANRNRVDLVEVALSRFGNTGVQQFVVEGAGSIDRYCAFRGDYFVMNEISMSLIEAAVFRVAPQISFAHLGTALAWLRVIAIGVFGFLLVRLGFSGLFVVCSLTAAMYLTVLLGGNALYSQYPFILPLTLLGIGAAGLCLSYEVHLRQWSLVTAAFGIGLWAGLLGNLRTSLYPGALAVGILFLLLGVIARRRSPGRLGQTRWMAFAGVSFTIGLMLFDFAFIRPIRILPASYNSSAHVIAHPLVLGLASPPNELSKREGIEWNDATGLTLAQRIAPHVSYLSAGYERALFTYYARLWANFPREMIRIYAHKFVLTTRAVADFIGSSQTDIFWSEKNGRWLGLAAWPITKPAPWLPLPLAFGGVFVVGWILGRRGHTDHAFLCCAIGIVGLLAFVESWVILGGVILWYSSLLVYCTVFVGLLAYQWLLDVTWRAVLPRALLKFSGWLG